MQDIENAKAQSRQLTILYGDIVGSSRISDTMDPEDFNARVLTRFQDLAEEVMQACGGYVNRFAGDGVQVLFGFPQAHEDHAERAVRAGLAFAARVKEIAFSDTANVEVRVGVATGRVMVGPMGLHRRYREIPVVGRAANLGAKLEALASPGEVLVSAETRALLSDSFHLNRSDRRIPGGSESVEVWTALSERTSMSRFEAWRRGHELAPFVGRDSELAFLVARMEAARAGYGQAVTIVGGPGMGKSRLVEEFVTRAKSASFSVLRYFCSPQATNTALYPIIQQLRFAAEIKDDDPQHLKEAKLESVLAGIGFDASELTHALPYLAAFLLVGRASEGPKTGESPERRKEITVALLRQVLAKIAGRNPVVMLFEDIHWSDPTTTELMTPFIEELRTLPIMLILTTREGATVRWLADRRGGQAPPAEQTIDTTAYIDVDSHAPILKLGPLEEAHRVRIVRHTAGAQVLPDEVVARIVSRSDGVPLFVEELTRMVLETGASGVGGSGIDDAFARAGRAVPNPLQGLLLARLDLLPEAAKEVAQWAATVGRESSTALLRAITGLEDVDLNAGIEHLLHADVIQMSGDAGETSIRFRHALFQDAAYSLQLKETRQRLHGTIARVLEEGFREFVDTYPERLAHHHTEAGEFGRATDYWKQAGTRAMGRAANREASDLFGRALDLIPELPEEIGRAARELELRILHGLSLSASLGYAAPAVAQAYERAEQLCHALGNSADLYAVIRGLCTYYIVRANLSRARELAEQCVRLGETSRKTEYLIEGHTALGYVRSYQGSLEEGVQLLSRGIALYREVHGENLTYPSAQDPCVACLCLQAHMLAIQGHVTKARRAGQEALDWADHLDRPFERAYARAFLAMLETILGRPDRAVGHATAGLEVSDRHGFDIWKGANALQLGIALTGLGQYVEAEQILVPTFAGWTAGGAELSTPYFQAGLADCLWKLGKREAGMTAIEEALGRSSSSTEKYYDPAVLCVRAGFHWELGDGDAAARDLEQAIAVAREQGAMLFELRALEGLERVTSKRGHRKRELSPELRRVQAELAA